MLLTARQAGSEADTTASRSPTPSASPHPRRGSLHFIVIKNYIIYVLQKFQSQLDVNTTLKNFETENTGGNELVFHIVRCLLALVFSSVLSPMVYSFWHCSYEPGKFLFVFMVGVRQTEGSQLVRGHYQLSQLLHIQQEFICSLTSLLLGHGLPASELKIYLLRQDWDQVNSFIDFFSSLFATKLIQLYATTGIIMGIYVKLYSLVRVF